MKISDVRLEIDSTGHGHVYLNGERVTNVGAITIKARVNDITTVAIEFGIVGVDATITGDVVTYISQRPTVDEIRFRLDEKIRETFTELGPTRKEALRLVKEAFEPAVEKAAG